MTETAVKVTTLYHAINYVANADSLLEAKIIGYWSIQIKWKSSNHKSGKLQTIPRVDWWIQNFVFKLVIN